MSRRNWLIYSIVTTAGEVLAVALALLLVLPRLGLFLSRPLAVGIMVALACWGVIGYYIGATVMGQRPALGNEAMRGKSGVVVKPLEPLGLVKIDGELWQAKCDTGHFDHSEEVIVVSQEGLHLTVEGKPRKFPDNQANGSHQIMSN